MVWVVKMVGRVEVVLVVGVDAVVGLLGLLGGNGVVRAVKVQIRKCHLMEKETK